MAFSLKKLAEQAIAQVVPFDNKTASTVRAQQAIPPARLPDPTVPKSSFKLTDNSLTRGLSRTYDQANIFDNNRTWQQTTPTQSKSSFQQAGQFGGQFVRSTIPATAKIANTVAAQVPQVYGTGRMLLASKTNNPVAFENARNFTDAANDSFNRSSGGLLNVGTLYSSQEAKSGDLKTGLKRIGGGIAQSATEVPSLVSGVGIGKDVVTGAGKKLSTRLINNAGLNASQGGLQAYNQDASVKDIAKNTLIGGAIGTVADIGLGVAGQGLNMAGRRAVKQVADNPLNESGYVKLPTGKNDIAPDLSPKQKEYINLYAEMIEGMGAGNGVDITPDGRRVSNNYRSPDLKGKQMTKADWFEEARRQIESGKAGYGASDDYKAIPGKKKPGSLPQQHEAYFNVEKANETVSLDKLVSSKTPEQNIRGGKSAPNLMKQAAGGKIPKRDPISVVPNGDGTFKVIDGNGTLTAAQKAGWSDLPVKVFDPKHVANSETLATRAQTIDKDFQATVKSVVKDLGLEYRVGPVKSFNRILRKVVEDYGGDATKVKDSVRGTVVMKDPTSLTDVINAFDKTGRIANIKNGYADVNNVAGYKDVKVIIQMPDGHLGEVIVATPEMLKAKKTGHALYKKVQDSTDQAEIGQLNDQMRELYGAAEAATAKRLASASETSRPSTIALAGGKAAPVSKLVPTTDLPSPTNLTGTSSTSTNLMNRSPALNGVMDDPFTSSIAENTSKGKMSSPTNVPAMAADTNPPKSIASVIKQQYGDTAPKKADGTLATDLKRAGVAPDKPTKLFPDESKLNTKRLNLDDEQRAILDEETIEVIGKLSNKDVERMARSAGMDIKTYGIEGTKKKIAEQLNVRKDAVRLMNERNKALASGDLDASERLILEASAQGRISRSQGTDIARQLQARKIIANELDTPSHRVFKLLDEAGVDPEKYAKRFRDVDFDNPKEVVKAFRELVPGKFANWLDTVRYNSMLSSPLTQIVNIFGNAQNVGIIAPVEKTLRGAIDAMGGLFGRERQYAATEGGAYVGAVAKSLGEASKNFVDALRGTGKYSNADFADDFAIPLASGGTKGAVYSGLTVPMRVLDGMDKFFRTLAESGEDASLVAREKAGIKIKGNRRALKDAEADYRVFQTEMGTPGQGVLNNALDEFASLAMKGRNSKSQIVSMVSKFTIPFVRTVNNINKQGVVDFSPLGFVNTIGNDDKTTAITRAIMGSAIWGTSAALLSTGQMTWAEPRNPDERNRFRSEGKQPYAVKIGGKWFGFSKLTPAVAFPMAMTAALDDAFNKGEIDDTTIDKVLEAFAKYGNFMSDQSYAKSIGDTLGAVGGDKEAIARAVSNNVQQLVPFRALSGWVARIGDDVERKVDTSQNYFKQQVESLMQQIPGLRDNTTTRDYKGEPIPSNNAALNAFSPVRVTNDRGVNPVDAESDFIKAAGKAAKFENDKTLSKSETQDFDKFLQPELDAVQNKLLEDPKYQALDVAGKKSALQKAKTDLTAARKQEYMAKNQVGEYAPDYTGKQTKLTEDQKALFAGGTVDFTKKPAEKAAKQPQTDYAAQLEKAQTKLSNPDLTPVQRIKLEDSIDSLKVKANYDTDVVSLYGMNKAAVYSYLTASPNSAKQAEELLSYGDALVTAGKEKKNKFRDSSGGKAFDPDKKAKSSGVRKNKSYRLFSSAGAMTTAKSLGYNRTLRNLVNQSRLKKKN